MSNSKIISIYTGLYSGSLRIAVKSKVGHYHERLDIYRYTTLRKLTASVIEHLVPTCPEFLLRLSAIDDRELMNNKHRKRRYIAERKDLLYLNSPHLENQHTQEVCGYWIATNFGRKETNALVKMACQAAEVKCESISTIKL